MADRFAAVFLFLLLALHGSHNSLFSRSRNPNEFIAPQDELALDELDPKMYADLLEEIPELRSHVKRPDSREPLRMPYLKNNYDQSDVYDFNGEEPDLSAIQVTPTPTPTRRAPETWNTTLHASSDTLPRTAPAAPARDERTASSANDSDTRRWSVLQYYWTGPRVATCYYCNMNNYRRSIPISTLCHDAWDSPDWQAKTMARYFRAHCYNNVYHWGWRFESKTVYNREHETDRGLYKGYYGGYIGGCFKRFLDVGKVYTARGCRSNEAKHGGGYGDHRYRKLERLLLGQKEACIMSPHASLTPFSRAVSLYVRYHVCVCEGKFCNTATPRTSATAPPPLLLLLLLLLYVVL